MPSRFTALAVSLLLLGAASAPARPRPEGPAERASYSLGHQIGRDLKQQGEPVDLRGLRQGLLDGIEGSPPAMEPAAMRGVLADLKRRVKASARVREHEEDRRMREQGREFLARHRDRPGVVTLASGLQYQILREGSGGSPGPGDKVVVHYRGETLDGRVFHDSRARPGNPETLHVSGVVAGLTEALQIMKAGSRVKIVLPPDLAYGRRGPLAHHTVIFEVELISILPGGGTAE